MTLGQQIQVARLEQGFTQQELADQLSVHKQQISNWEVGSRTPQIKNLERIGEALQTSFSIPVDKS